MVLRKRFGLIGVDLYLSLVAFIACHLNLVKATLGDGTCPFYYKNEKFEGCHKGYYTVGFDLCMQPYPNAKCVPCPKGTYNSEKGLNVRKRCNTCRFECLKEREVEVIPCTSTTDRRCECSQDYTNQSGDPNRLRCVRVKNGRKSDFRPKPHPGPLKPTAGADRDTPVDVLRTDGPTELSRGSYGEERRWTDTEVALIVLIVLLVTMVAIGTLGAVIYCLNRRNRKADGPITVGEAQAMIQRGNPSTADVPSDEHRLEIELPTINGDRPPPYQRQAPSSNESQNMSVTSTMTDSRHHANVGVGQPNTLTTSCALPSGLIPAEDDRQLPSVDRRVQQGSIVSCSCCIRHDCAMPRGQHNYYLPPVRSHLRHEVVCSTTAQTCQSVPELVPVSCPVHSHRNYFQVQTCSYQEPCRAKMTTCPSFATNTHDTHQNTCREAESCLHCSRHHCASRSQSEQKQPVCLCRVDDH